jgi:hypothetical protein
MLPLKKEYEWVGKSLAKMDVVSPSFQSFTSLPYANRVATWQQLNKIKHLRKKRGNKLGNNYVKT